MTASATIEIHPSLTDVDRQAWNACAGGAQTLIQSSPPNPFVSYEFLAALEQAGCVGPASGWHPAYLVLPSADHGIDACCAAYIKSNSAGEYVFDYGWADAFERAGGRYYPKIQVSAPFTPVTGPRLLARPDTDGTAARDALIGGLMALCERFNASSIHLTFLNQEEAGLLEDQAFLRRDDIQYHWVNEAYADFDAFLASLASRKRKAIRRERRAAADSGLTFIHKRGSDITEADWDAFFSFYLDTGSRKWGQPYLNRAFFSLIGETMAEQLLLIFAMQDGEPVAGALNFIGADTLYGRYWGTTIDQPFLHFETCYYQAIDFAIAEGLKVVEAGAQGPHKLARGYRPVITRSAHFIRHPGLRRAVEDYLAMERPAIEGEARTLTQHLPFRRDKSKD